jgi:hypothetical protein
MIQTWLDSPTPVLFVTLAAFYAVTGTIVASVVFGRIFKPLTGRIEGVAPAYFGVVSILFALLTGFLASDISDRNRQAARAVQTEAGALRNVFTLSVAATADMHDIRAAWRAYVESVVNDDWPAMARGEMSATTDHAYDRLLHEVADPGITSTSGAAVQNALLNETVRVGTARSDRSTLANDRTNDVKWIMVLLLGVMTQVGIGVVHLQKRGAHIAALAIFSTAAVITLGLVALQESPFEGPVEISPAPFQALLKLGAPGG